MVFDIERYAIEDGPGIRTLVFLKGCPLGCVWCANPESQKATPDVFFYADKCRGCGRCIEGCPQGAVQASEKYGLTVDEALCVQCGQCAKTCSYDARKLSGKKMTAAEVISEVMKDKLFYDESGGGVTFSGGEPFVQPAFLQSLLQLSKKEGLHTAVETCGIIPFWENKEALGLLDLVFCDLKHTDDAKHRAFTGAGNGTILQNIEYLCNHHKNVVLRVPCVPGFNDTEAEMTDIFGFMQGLGSGLKRVELLPYHRLGTHKYQSLSREYALSSVLPLAKKDLLPFRELGRQMGLPVAIGADDDSLAES
ncbi:MAG: glycyl-radical enzyme activating protein [Christensenellaceae bacterium]